MQITIGGQRIGSGQKMQTELHDYGRSSHNLSTDFTASFGAGILYPCLVKPCLRGEHFEIKASAGGRTIPTEGPLFGSFKLQVDYYQCPMRLYQGLLHNNAVKLGLNMNKVMLPMLEIYTSKGNMGADEAGKFSLSCLQKYLGMSGIGKNTNANVTEFGRDVMAIPTLAYYDIFKNYYANKQEENAYVITLTDIDLTLNYVQYEQQGNWEEATETGVFWLVDLDNADLPTSSLLLGILTRLTNKNDILSQFGLNILNGSQTVIAAKDLKDYAHNISWSQDDGEMQIGVFDYATMKSQYPTAAYIQIYYKKHHVDRQELNLVPFPLENIDKMRYDLLSHNELGTAFTIDEGTAYLPYRANVARTLDTGVTYNKYSHNGLCVKTYQSDIFNNWLNTEWIDGENGITEITKIIIQDGAFTIDEFNLNEKLYNMLNRVVLSGATYEEWQNVIYTKSNRSHIESPVYLGGMSAEIRFEEIVQTTPTENEPLGHLGGRGVLTDFSGGDIEVNIDEASFIIGIASLTPRIVYTQGNEFYLTDIKTMDDWHKPALDGIGFQNLMGERMAWFDTEIGGDGKTVVSRSVIGKVPAWLEYQTDVDRAYGDMADIEGKGYMVLNRNYEATDDGQIKDATTYIDPTKYNYAFAYTEIDAQNFWIQIKQNIVARRLMSANQIPNV